MRHCRHKECEQVNPQELAEFYTTTSRPDGLDTWCRSCRIRYQRERYAKPKFARKRRVAQRLFNRRHPGRRWSYIKTKPQRRLRNTVSRSIWRALRTRGGSKAGLSCFTALGYTPQELCAHVEVRFKPGMSWDNYGRWHLDHIKAESKFKYTAMSDAEFKACWALTNLQPLWADENIRKGSKDVTAGKPAFV